MVNKEIPEDYLAKLNMEGERQVWQQNHPLAKGGKRGPGTKTK